jgi:hypothetical protein
MAIFRRKTTTIESLEAQRVNLAAQLNAAELALAKAREAATAVMLETRPGDKLDAAENAVIRAAERVSTCGLSIIAVETELRTMREAEAQRLEPEYG